MRTIAIVGSRSCQGESLEKLKAFASEAFGGADRIYSGNAVGVDSLARLAVPEKITLWLPWASYNAESIRPGEEAIDAGSDERYDELIESLFPWFAAMKDTVKPMIRRDAFIALGDWQRPKADEVLWHTGKGLTGGTSYCVLIARSVGIKTTEF